MTAQNPSPPLRGDTEGQDLAQTIDSWGLPIGVEDPSSPYCFPPLESHYQLWFSACRVKREMNGKSLLISVKGPGGEDLLKHLKDWIENDLPKQIVMPEALEIPESWWKPVGNERLDGVVGIMNIIPSTERKS